MSNVYSIVVTEFELKMVDTLSADEGKIFGYANTKNVMDKVGDVVLDGAYSDLEKTLSEGFIANYHEHDEPLGYFTEIYEDEKGLYFEAKFHTTPKAQEIYQIIKERVQNNKKVTMSIGYQVKDAEIGTFEGKKCRYLKSIFVKEVSFTLVPANDESVVEGVKREEQFIELKQNIDKYSERVKQIFALGRGENWLNERKNEIDTLENALAELRVALKLLEVEEQSDEETKSENLDVSGELELAKARARAILA